MEPGIAYGLCFVASASALDPAVVRMLVESVKARWESGTAAKEELWLPVRLSSNGLGRPPDWRLGDRSRAEQSPGVRCRQEQRQPRPPPSRVCVGVRAAGDHGRAELTLWTSPPCLVSSGPASNAPTVGACSAG